MLDSRLRSEYSLTRPCRFNLDNDEEDDCFECGGFRDILPIARGLESFAGRVERLGIQSRPPRNAKASAGRAAAVMN